MKKIGTCLLLALGVSLIGCSSTLSNDIYSFDVKIEDEKYTVPFKFKELKNDDWDYVNENNTKETIMSGETSNICLKKDDKIVNVSIISDSNNDVTDDECDVMEISLNKDNIKSGTNIEFPKGIKTTSTKDEVIEAYGEPTRIDEYSFVTNLTYQIGDLSFIEFSFDNQFDKIQGIRICNLKDDIKNRK